jgi:RNA 2',3'-cyclic 3'-phosphodiesterase
MPRLFVAVDLAERARLLLDPLLGAFPGGRWASREQLHVTLRFLGSVAPDQVGELRRRLESVVSPASFSLSLSGVGVFPPAPSKRSPPRVLWAGLRPRDPLAALKLAIDQALGPDPELGNREFHPHVTLARWKDPPGPELAGFLDRHAGLTSAPFDVREFHLYESRTLPEGAVYTRLHSFNLSPQAPPAKGA